MEVFETVQCPFCGAGMEVSIDTTVAEQCYVTDCEVCCRPFQLQVECEPGAVLGLEVLAN